MHRKPIVLRGQSVATPTALVRNRVKIQMNRTNQPHAKLAHDQAHVGRSPRFTTPTPLVAPRVVVRKNKLNQLRARVKRDLVITRSRVPSVRPPRQIVEMNRENRKRARARRKAFISHVIAAAPLVVQRPRKSIVEMSRQSPTTRARRRFAKILRSPSVTTPTPLVRNRVRVEMNRGNALRGRGRLHPFFTKPKTLAPSFVFVRSKIVVARRRRDARVTQHDRARVVRSFVAPSRPRRAPLTPRRRSTEVRSRARRRVVSTGLRTPRVVSRVHQAVVVSRDGFLARRARRNQVELLRSRVTPPPIPRRPTEAIVVLRQRANLIAARRRRAHILARPSWRILSLIADYLEGFRRTGPGDATSGMNTFDGRDLVTGVESDQSSGTFDSSGGIDKGIGG